MDFDKNWQTQFLACGVQVKVKTKAPFTECFVRKVCVLFSVIQLLFVFNVLTILLYQWPFKAFDCQFSEFAKLFVSSFLIQKTSPLPIHKEEPDKNRYSFLLLMRCLTLRELQFVYYVTRISRAKLVHKFLNCSNVFALRKYLIPEIILPKRA